MTISHVKCGTMAQNNDFPWTIGHEKGAKMPPNDGFQRTIAHAKCVKMAKITVLHWDRD